MIRITFNNKQLQLAFITLKKKHLLFFLLMSGLIIAQNADRNSRYQLAREYELKNEPEKAKEILEELYKETPANPLYFNELQQLYLQLGYYNESINIINNFLKVTSNDLNLYGKLGDTYFKMGKREKAFDVWNEALKIPFGNNFGYRIISNYIIQNRAYDEAIEVLKKGRELSGNDDAYTMDIAHLYAITMQYENSVDEYCRLLLEQPNQLSGIQARINSYLTREEAVHQFTNAIEKFYEEHQTNVIASLLSHIYKRTNNYERAYELDYSIDKNIKANGEIIFRFAEDAFANKAYAPAAKAYKYIIDEVQNLTLLPGSYLGYVNSKEMELKNLFDQKLEWEYSAQSDTSMFDQYRELIGEYSRIQRLFKRSDISCETNYRIGYIYYSILKEPDVAEKYFKQSFSEMKNSRYALLSREELSEITLQKGNLSEGVKLLNELISFRNSQEEDLNRYKLLLSRIYFWQNNFKAALKLLNELTDNKQDDSANDGIELTIQINAANKDSVSLSKIAEADFLYYQKKYSESSEIYKKISETPGLFYLSDYAGIKYIETLLFSGQVPLAITVLEKIVQKEIPGIFADKAVFLLGEIFQYAVEDYEKASRVYEKLLEEFPGSLYFDRCRVNLAIINSRERNNS